VQAGRGWGSEAGPVLGRCRDVIWDVPGRATQTDTSGERGGDLSLRV
jgi:hypothetical protein